MRAMISPGSPCSLASSVGFVVAPDSTPQAAISSTSATDPVSMNSFTSSLLSNWPWSFLRCRLARRLEHQVLERAEHVVELHIRDHRDLLVGRAPFEVALELADLPEARQVAGRRPV